MTIIMTHMVVYTITDIEETPTHDNIMPKEVYFSVDGREMNKTKSTTCTQPTGI